ncbi:hypothetical protein B0T19DRAFT_397161 [Cercophora scortea]|uniref:Uncharacterized protein n=1 Tax=Cercophora scortea TaxID=314031 RepID=A0AAE0J5Z9_9PEZI|nr:hypothetical protein B0T19DRAFT_397161 [Cercophora scortea]
MTEIILITIHPAEFEASQNTERSLVLITSPPSLAELNDDDAELVIDPNQEPEPSRHRESQKKAQEYESRNPNFVPSYADDAKYYDQRKLNPSRRPSTRTHKRPEPSNAERDAFANAYRPGVDDSSRRKAPIPPAPRPPTPPRMSQRREPVPEPPRYRQRQMSEAPGTQNNTKRPARSSSQTRNWEDNVRVTQTPEDIARVRGRHKNASNANGGNWNAEKESDKKGKDEAERTCWDRMQETNKQNTFDQE